jgi:hypothetical protein
MEPPSEPHHVGVIPAQKMMRLLFWLWFWIRHQPLCFANVGKNIKIDINFFYYTG